eukprot:576934-Karenia_brevis.AAC.1
MAISVSASLQLLCQKENVSQATVVFSRMESRELQLDQLIQHQHLLQHPNMMEGKMAAQQYH